MRILFLSRWFPYPANNGSKLRIYNLLRGLAAQHEVTLLSFVDQAAINVKVPEIQSICQEVHVTPWKPFAPQSLQARLGFWGLAPRSLVNTFSIEMKQCIDQILYTQKPDVIIVSELPMLSYGAFLQGLPALFEDLELGVIYEESAATVPLWRRFRYRLTWLKLRYYIAKQLRHFQVCTVVSEKERQLLTLAVPGYKPVDVIPNCINLANYTDIHEIQKPHQLIFSGSFSYRANYDAMVWFLQEVYPIIQRKIPSIHLTITGDHAGLPLPPSANVTLSGFVDDVRPLIAQSGVSLAPLLSGGGTRLKILEAMALGTSVVATTKGAEGLDLQTNEHLLIADEPQAFAQAVIRLCEEAGLRQRLVNNAYKVLREKYDWATTLPRFLRLVEQVAHT